jgi:hypothetical protein
MVRPVDGVASITQSQNALELVQTAQRLAALATARQQGSTAVAKEAQATTVNKQAEAQGRTIRDDEPRRRRPRRDEKDQPELEEDAPPEHIDIKA